MNYAKVRYLSNEGEYLFPLDIFGKELSVEDALETIFCQCQNDHPAGSWLAKNHRKRSLSVGDVVTFKGNNYVCAGAGWDAVTPEVAEWLVTRVTSRDFCHNVATTLKFVPKDVLAAYPA